MDVFTFHGLAEELATRAGIGLTKRHGEQDYWDTELPQALADAVEALPEQRYDAIVVDEAQDIDAVWWLPLLDLLADRERGRLFVFGDANQDLYHAEPDEIGVVMPDRPPVYLLEENRRTTRAIHDWAQRWASARPLEADGEALTLTPRAVGPAGRPVQVVTYAEGSDAEAACRRAVASVLKELIGPGGGVKPSDVVVLTPRSPRTSWLAGAKVGSWTLVSEAGADGSVLPPPSSAWEVRLSTIHRFKGLEAPVVILAEIDSRVPRGSNWRDCSTWVRPGRGRTWWSSVQRTCWDRTRRAPGTQRPVSGPAASSMGPFATRRRLRVAFVTPMSRCRA